MKKKEATLVLNSFVDTNQFWNDITKTLSSSIGSNENRVVTCVEELESARDRFLEILEEIVPTLIFSWKEDSKILPWKRLWGLSRNFDVRMDCSLVDEEILEIISDISGVSPPLAVDSVEGCIAHAGVLHTYGYLFCDISSSLFGFKRDRWIHNNIESSFALNYGCLSPFPQQGTLCSNATYFIGRIAFRDLNEKLMVLEQFSDIIEQSLVFFHYDQLKVIRITEEIIIDSTFVSSTSTSRQEDENTYVNSGESESRILRLFTDIVAPLVEGETHILVYSVYDSLPNDYFLITVFPVAQDAIDELLCKPVGEEVSITIRYNTFVEGINGKTMCGSRKVS
jgi:hypothetical protein